jgi:hypothetical protein
LFLLGDVAVVLAGIGTFLAADGAVLLVQCVRLLLADFAFLAFLMDALVLIGQTVVHFGAARVLFCHSVSAEAVADKLAKVTADRLISMMRVVSFMVVLLGYLWLLRLNKRAVVVNSSWRESVYNPLFVGRRVLIFVKNG